MKKERRDGHSCGESMNFEEGMYPERILRQSRATGGPTRSPKATVGEEKMTAKRGGRMTRAEKEGTLYGTHKKMSKPKEGNSLYGNSRHRQAVKTGGKVDREHKSLGDLVGRGIDTVGDLVSPFLNLLKEGGTATKSKRGGSMTRKCRAQGDPVYSQDGMRAKKGGSARHKHAAGAVAKIRKGEY